MDARVSLLLFRLLCAYLLSQLCRKCNLCSICCQACISPSLRCAVASFFPALCITVSFPFILYAFFCSFLSGVISRVSSRFFRKYFLVGGECMYMFNAQEFPNGQTCKGVFLDLQIVSGRTSSWRMMVTWAIWRQRQEALKLGQTVTVSKQSQTISKMQRAKHSR